MAVYKIKWDDASTRSPVQGGLARSRREHSPKLSSVETLWPVVRLHMANEATNGEVFLQPLSSIREILESTVLQQERGRGSEGSEVASGKGAQMALYYLAIEYIPRLLSYMPRIRTNKPETGILLLDILCYLLALEKGNPYPFLLTYSSSLLHLSSHDWSGACQEILSRLCHFILPTCLLPSSAIPSPSSSLPPMSMTSTLMVVLETCTTRHHLLLTDTLMFLKRDVCTDILSLIAHGTHAVLHSALKLLLHYWPPSSELSPNVSPYGEWQALECENVGCRCGNAQASTLCLNASCVARHKSRGCPKLYLLLCHECHSVIHRSVTDSDNDTHQTIQIPSPLRDVKPNCEFQKKCLGKESQVNRAEVTCYDKRCTAIQGGQPIRMCRACHTKQHAELEDHSHIYQVGPPNPWTSSDLGSSSTMLEAVSKLLQCSPSLHKTSTVPSTINKAATHTLVEGLQKIHTLPYQLMVEGSREGIWLLSQFCTPTGPVLAGQYEWLVHLSALALDWLRSYYDVLRGVEEEIPSSPHHLDDSDNPSPDVTEYLQYFSNYNDISRLVDPLLTTWLCEVAKTNGDCLVAALQPHPQPCAQVGKLWDRECDSILRYQSSLRSLHRLYQYFKSSHIPKDAFMNIFNKVMPEWLDLLVQLRTETGKMATLHTHYHRLLSHSSQPAAEGLEMADFICDRFGGEETSGAEMQRALFWLQDLTRLKIVLPYISHAFASGMEHKSNRRTSNSGTGRGGGRGAKPTVSVTSSFDEQVEERQESMERGRKRSSTSNASDSESALVSDSYLEEVDTQAIASLNSSLTRSILMLDIWLSQMKLGAHRLDYGMLKKLLLQMLQMPWGSKHSYTDHHETTNSCLLCKATALWFSLTTQLLEESEKQLEEEDREQERSRTDGDIPTRLQQQRISMKLALRKLKQLTHEKTTVSDVFPPSSSVVSPGGGSGGGKFGTFPRKRRGSDERGTSPGAVSNKGKSPRGSGDLTDFDREFTPAEVKSKPRKNPLRKMPTVQGDSSHQPPSFSALLEKVSEEREEGEGGEREEESEDLHLVFQLCRDHLKPRLHPEATHKVVQCVIVLLRRCRVLHDMGDDDAIREARFLFKDVWKCLTNQSSYVTRSCVALLLDCLKFLNEHELSRGLETSTGWVTFRDGLKTDKFKTVEKFCIFLEFMLSPETDLDWNDAANPTIGGIQVMVGYSFCLAVKLLQDRTSSVASRAHYCLSNLSISTLKALRKFLMRLFLDHPSHRILALHSLSLLNTALPRLGLLTLELAEGLVSCLTPLPPISPSTFHQRFNSADRISKKESVGSELSGQTPKTSISSGLPSSPIPSMASPEEESELLQLALALLLKYLANPESNAEESLKRTKQERSHRESSIEPELRPAVLSQLPALHHDPPSLRTNPVFHVFLDHIYPVLDQNPEFSTASALGFILNRLVTCTAPTGEEPFLQILEPGAGGHEGTRCEFGLGILPPSLREPWLRVFYVILYKYIHNYQTGVSDLHHDLIFVVRCCMEVVLNTMEASPHTCSLLLPGSHAAAPPLRSGASSRQKAAEGYHGGSASQPTYPLEFHTFPRGERRGASLSPVREESPSALRESSPAPLAHKAVQKMTSVDSVDSVGSFSSVFLCPSSMQNLHSGLCSVCGRVTNEFAEEVITNCAIVVATCCQRLPTRVSGYLVSRIIPALAKVIETGRESSSSSDDQAPGSARAVASNLLQSTVTQFADRRLFIFLFGHSYDGEGVAERVFGALGASLPAPPPIGEGEGEGGEEGGEGTNMASPVTYFLQDAVNSHNFQQDVHPLSLVHLALYVEKTPLSLSHMFRNINLLDLFCKKLRTTSLLRDERAVHAFLRFIIQVLVSAPDNMPQNFLRTPAAHSFTQSFTACLEVILCRVACPVAGLFQLAHHWYKTFLASPRDANRLAVLYVSQLRQALKVNQTTEILNSATFVSLIQVLLLEERGYLSYVDGLSVEKAYASRLRDEFEFRDLFLNAIHEQQWDLMDSLLFLDASPHRLPDQYLHELARQKLLMAQLVALRVQHSRTPVEYLRRVINEDVRSILIPSRGSHQRSTAVRWHDHLSSLHVLSWLLLGATCHNAVHQVYSSDHSSDEGGDQCQLLRSLDASLEVITNGAIRLTRGAIQNIRRTSENSGSQSQFLLFTFTTIWTHYMEMWEQDCAPAIVQFWENLVSNLHDLLTQSNTDEKHVNNVLHNLNDKVIVPLKKCGLSSFTLLLPVWRKLSMQLPGRQEIFPVVPDNLATVTMDTWCKEMVAELVTVERESSPHIATTAL